MDAMTFSLVGAVYGASFAVGISRRASVRESSSDRWLSGLISCAVIAIVTIVLQHRTREAFAIQILERFEHVSMLASGPILLLYIRSLRQQILDWRSVLHFVPAVAVAVVAISVAAPIEVLVAHQIAYTALAAYRRVGFVPTSVRDSRISSAALLVMFVVHAAQVARIAGSSSQSLTDIVPVTISLAALSVGGVLSMISVAQAGERRRVERSSQPPPPSGAARNAPAEAGVILESLETALKEGHIYRRTDLGLHDLAELLGVTPHQLSGALNSVAGTGFVEVLTRYRLEDAKRRLLDPEHDTYTIEAIGEMSGFGSRSSFHAVFRRELGTTPVRFRSSQRAEEKGTRARESSPPE